MFILNRALTRRLKSMTPSYGRSGCISQIKMMPNLTKLKDRSTSMVLLGYEEGSKAYRLYIPHGGKVVASWDVVFDEMVVWDWKDLGVQATRFVHLEVIMELVKKA